MVRVIVADVTVSAEPSVQAPPTPLNVISAPNATPLVVTVLPVVVALKVVVPVYVRVRLVAGKERLPDTVNPILVPASVIVKSRPDAVKSLQSRGEFAIVTIKLPPASLPASKITLSAAVGTDAPLAPPEDADQFAVFVELQEPVPPTQYLLRYHRVAISI